MPAGVLVAMPIVVGPRVAPPMPAPVPALEVVAVALAADIAGAGSAVLLPPLFSLSPRRRYSCRPFRCRRRCAPPGDEPPRTREAETATTKRTTETDDCAYAGRSSIPISSQAETDDGPWPSIARHGRHRICRRYDNNGENTPGHPSPRLHTTKWELADALARPDMAHVPMAGHGPSPDASRRLRGRDTNTC